MALTKEDKIPRVDRVMIIDTKTIDLDRALINLFMLLKHGGAYPSSRTGIVDRTTDMLAKWLCEDPNFSGFAQYPEVVKEWLEADFLDLVNRGTDNEALAAPRPIHLNSYKLRNARHCRDYGASAQLYRLLADENDQLPRRLREFLLRGCDPTTDKFQGNADSVDIETLTILRLADREGKDAPGAERVPPYTPLCVGQGRLLRNDIRRLLRYEDVIPRPMLVEYFKTLCGLHLALFVRRLAYQIETWMRLRSITSECRQCPVEPTNEIPMIGCPFPLEFIVDMGNQPNTRMASLSQASAQGHFEAMDSFIKDLMGLTKLIQYVDTTGFRAPNSLALVTKALEVYAGDDPDFRGYCRAKLSTIIGMPPDGRFERIRDQFQDDPFHAYVECILLERFSWHRGYFRQLFRSLLSINHDTGMLVSGRSTRSPVRFHLGTRLLETLVQIAVLKPHKQEAARDWQFRSEPMLVSDLLNWLRHRYGIAIGAAQVQGSGSLAPADLKALRENEEHFKEKLREIGFYTDLSDAYNSQRVTPRYRVGE
jgi:hypothetical protein